MMRSFAIPMMAACLLLSMLASRPVLADANTAKAKQLYEDGVTNYNLGHFDEALTAFESAYRLRRDPAFLFNIAQCQRNLKHYEDAQRTYRAYLRESPDLPQGTRAQIQQIMGEMDRAIAEERAKQPPTGTQPPTTTQPAETAAPPTATTQAAPPAVVVPATREANESELHAARTKRIAGLAVGGFGIAALALGGAFTGLANDANRHIVTGTTWSAATEDRRNTYQALDATFFAIGGVAVATGVVLYLIGRHDERKRYPIERVQISPAIGVHVAGLNIGGRF